jgi:signal transduction histidine kinase
MNAAPRPDRPGEQAARLSEIDLEARLRFLDLTAADAENGRKLLPEFRVFGEKLVAAFYAHLFAFEEMRAFLQDPVLVARLKKSQLKHFESMLSADWNPEYVRQRFHVGEVHAEVGIDPEHFLGAYNQFFQHSVRNFAEGESAETRAFAEKMLSLIKLIVLDVGLTLDAFFVQSTQTLQNALQLLWKANAELRQFAQFTSHDLKTPLATVANLCDEALDEFRDQMPAAAAALVEAAKQRTYKMSTMIDELLALSEPEESDHSNEDISSQQALDEAIERVRPLLAAKRIDIRFAAPLPTVWGNRVRLREAFYNLLSNAIKFIEKTPGKIDIGAQFDDQLCTIAIADNGPGIPPEDLERIFSPFRRLATHRDRPGSGLGLYFTKNLIEQQDGQVWAESAPGGGSCFFVRLRRGPRP